MSTISSVAYFVVVLVLSCGKCTALVENVPYHVADADRRYRVKKLWARSCSGNYSVFLAGVKSQIRERAGGRVRGKGGGG